MMKSNNSQTPKKTKKSHKFRNAMLAILFVALVGVASVVVTWALADATDFGSVTNEFANTSPISVEMEENFDAESALLYEPRSVIRKQPLVKNTSSTIDSPTSDSSHSEWVAVKLTYTVTFPKTVYTQRSENRDGITVCPYFTQTNEEDCITCTYDTYDDFADALAQVSVGEPTFDSDSGIFNPAPDGFNTTYWTAYDGNKTLFIYNDTLAPQNTTPNALFSWVAVNNHTKVNYSYYTNDSDESPSGTMSLYPISLVGAKTYNSSDELVAANTLAGADSESMSNTVYVASLPTFDIKMTAYAVQADGLATLDLAKQPLHDIAFPSAS